MCINCRRIFLKCCCDSSNDIQRCDDKALIPTNKKNNSLKINGKEIKLITPLKKQLSTLNIKPSDEIVTDEANYDLIPSKLGFSTVYEEPLKDDSQISSHQSSASFKSHADELKEGDFIHEFKSLEYRFRTKSKRDLLLRHQLQNQIKIHFNIECKDPYEEGNRFHYTTPKVIIKNLHTRNDDDVTNKQKEDRENGVTETNKDKVHGDEEILEYFDSIDFEGNHKSSGSR